jgi:ATP-binding cassette subfamily C (CFTR/MRP) protein 1
MLLTTNLQIPNASSGLHSTLLDTVMHAPLSFFTTTDSGTTLNRFSQDMSLVDLDLPDSFLDFVFCLMAVVVVGALMSASATYFLAAVPVAIFALYGIQRYYLRTSRQMRFLDLEAKAPLYSHFQETLGGLASIRAFGWVDQFTQQNLELLDQSQRPFYLMFCIQRWLAVVLDLLVAGLATVLMVIVVSLRKKIDPALVGLGLLNVMTFNVYLTALVQMWTQMETSIGAIARLRDFVKTTENERKKEENMEPPEKWPHEGALEISHFAASYSTSPTSNTVLNDINLNIRPGEKFGICGRSGSGKSSLLASLFHLLEYRDGAINLDGHNLAFIPRDILRQRLNVIPQDPYWISTKSVRFNMDPWFDLTAVHEDARFIEALMKCQVWHIIEAKGGLDATMDQEFLSHGQRQLFCLARAILRKSKVVVLDEVSARYAKSLDSFCSSSSSPSSSFSFSSPIFPSLVSSSSQINFMPIFLLIPFLSILSMPASHRKRYAHAFRTSTTLITLLNYSLPQCRHTHRCLDADHHPRRIQRLHNHLRRTPPQHHCRFRPYRRPQCRPYRGVRCSADTAQ